MTPDQLRRSLLDWAAVEGDGGPGVTNDHRGSWHLFCHLAAAGAVYRLPPNGSAWVGILYSQHSKQYYPALSVVIKDRNDVMDLNSQHARDLIAKAKWLGYLEGASRGHILDRAAQDPGNPTKVDRRQDYDRPVTSAKDGGPVWEMWTVSRDIRATNRLGTSLVEAYFDLLKVLGGRFAATVARGRIEPEYGHLRQMCALIDAGIVAPSDALYEIEAAPIPPHVERLLLQARPESFAQAAAALARATRQPRYYMYRRKLSSFAPASLLRRLVATLGPTPGGSAS